MEMNNYQNIIKKNQAMIHDLRYNRGCDKSVLDIMEKLDRDHFLPADMKNYQLDMKPMPIGYGQTMSAPFIVASMSALLEIKPGEKVLEIGTGCGYQTAVLSGLGACVYSVEYLNELVTLASKNLKSLGLKNYFIKNGDGYFGWPENAPYDKIIAAATAPFISEFLISQLVEGGIIVLPLEKDDKQYMVKATKINGRLDYEWLYGVRFVPFVGAVRL
jgi:protein-L-isoaspartate(D-aspartate) O-methyltransferase